MRAYLIDPSLQRISLVELPKEVTEALIEMRRLIGCETLGGGKISNMHDQLWCDDIVFSSQQPCFAFKIRGHGADMGPFGGKCIITGADRYGNSQAPHFPLSMLQQDVEWLGEIYPTVEWVEDHKDDLVKYVGIVTYSRSAKP